MEEAIQVEDRWYVLATSSLADDRIRVLKHGDTFAVFDRFGDIQPIGPAGQGIYHQGTRCLSRMELYLNGKRPLLLRSGVKQDNSLLTIDLTTPDFYDSGELTVHKGTVHMLRAKLLWNAACHEHLRLVNFGGAPIALSVLLRFGADYADIFEVRGFRRAHRGTDLPPTILADGLILGYEGLDGVTRHTVLRCSPPPAEIGAGQLEYALVLPPGGTSDLYLTIQCEPSGSNQVPADYPRAQAAAEQSLRDAQRRACTVYTSNEQFNEWLDRSSADLQMLTTDTPAGPYPYAGVPWYSTPFGRDGILTALQYLWVDPTMARGVLAYLAKMQATEENPAHDAEPGKILHETRSGELAMLDEIPFRCYYGSIDATPLFVVLAAAYLRRTGDLPFVQQIWPNVTRALDWIDRYGDIDGDGLVEYRRRCMDGLANQGWKDSEDAVFHRDGTLAQPPIALAEVQGYVYLARLLAAELSLALGEPERAAALREQASRLRSSFEQVFWSKELGTYAIALDGRKQPCLVRSSNAGQVLWSGIASRRHMQQVAETLLAPHSFSGWGVRTISEGEARYNPMSYHNGSVWPHDNALIAMGLARCGMKDKSLSILGALFDASQFMDQHRLPELYCGFERRPREGPTLYPVACSPQAWASACVFYLLQACLGLSFDAPARRIQFDHPLLPPWLDRVEVRQLRLNDALVDLAFERHEQDVGVNVLHKKGELDVSVLL